MTVKDFYRILSLVKGMRWELVYVEKPAFGVPSKKNCIRGERHSFFYSPTSAVASCVRRRFVDRSDALNSIIRLDVRTFRRIDDAVHQHPGYSRVVRRRLLRACGLDEASS